MLNHAVIVLYNVHIFVNVNITPYLQNQGFRNLICMVGKPSWLVSCFPSMEYFVSQFNLNA